MSKTHELQFNSRAVYWRIRTLSRNLLVAYAKTRPDAERLEILRLVSQDALRLRGQPKPEALTAFENASLQWDLERRTARTARTPPVPEGRKNKRQPTG